MTELEYIVKHPYTIEHIKTYPKDGKHLEVVWISGIDMFYIIDKGHDVASKKHLWYLWDKTTGAKINAYKTVEKAVKEAIRLMKEHHQKQLEILNNLNL